MKRININLVEQENMKIKLLEDRVSLRWDLLEEEKEHELWTGSTAIIGNCNLDP